MTPDNTSFKQAVIAMFSDQQYNSSYLFYGHMIAQCRVIYDDAVQIAGVSFDNDHYNLYVGLTEFSKLTLENRLFVLQHEMHHILGGHVARTDTRDPKQWNYSTDAAINQLGNHDHSIKVTQTDIDEYGAAAALAGKPLILGDDMGVFPHNFPTKNKNLKTMMHGEYYYDNIDSEQLPPECSQCSGTGTDGDGEPCDNCNGTGQAPGSGQPTGDHSKWAESKGDPELQKDITKDMLEKSINATQKARGTLPAGISDYLALHSRKQQVSWQKVLKNIVGNKKVNSRRTIMRQDRRQPHMEHIKGKTKNRMFGVLCVLDTSGSMSNDSIVSTLAEVANITRITNSDLDLIQVDTTAYPPEKFNKNKTSFVRKACGGTDLHHSLAMAKEYNIDYQCVVVLTDGYLCTSDVQHFIDTKKRIIWLIEPEGNVMPEMTQKGSKAFQLKN